MNNYADVIDTIISVYLNDNDEFIVCHDVSPEINTNIKIHKNKIKNLDSRFSYDEMENAISNDTKIIYFSTPNFETGELIRASTFEILAKKYQDILFVIDCSYINYAQNVMLADFFDLADNYENIIIVKSFTYDFSLVGIELCYIYAQKNIIDNLKKITISDNINYIALQCAIAIINNYSSFEEIKEQNISVREAFFEMLIQKGFKPYKSEGNFILCDFLEYFDFYYKKLKNNGVLSKKYEKSSPYSTCLRLTVPKMGGVKYISELLNKKNLLIISDNVIFDVRKSYNIAIAETFKYFAGFEIKQDDIIHVKNIGGYKNDYQVIKYLLEQQKNYVDLEEIIKVFTQNFNSLKLINNVELLVTKETFVELSEKYDIAIISTRLAKEIKYLTHKFEIDDSICYICAQENIDTEDFKPEINGLSKIFKYCPFKKIKYMGSSVDDIISGNKANIETIGVIIPGADKNNMTNNFKHLCADYIIDDIGSLANLLKYNEQF